MENAIIINREKDYKSLNKKYDRIYFGNEFCPRLLPENKEIKNILSKIKKDKIELTLLTPQLDSQGLKSSVRILKYLSKKNMLKEVVVNDYGLLGLMKKSFPHCEIILGRLLSRFVSLNKDNFLNKIGIKRVEFDDLVEIKKRKKGLFSYYYPYMPFFTSRYCPVADISKNKLKNHGIIKCSKECLKIGELELSSFVFKRPVVLKGNTQFIKKATNIKSLDKRKVNRLVFQPKIPI